MKRSTFKTAAVAAGTVALVAALAACFALTPANLEQIMVHLEREAEA